MTIDKQEMYALAAQAQCQVETCRQSCAGLGITLRELTRCIANTQQREGLTHYLEEAREIFQLQEKDVGELFCDMALTATRKNIDAEALFDLLRDISSLARRLLDLPNAKQWPPKYVAQLKIIDDLTLAGLGTDPKVFEPLLTIIETMKLAVLEAMKNEEWSNEPTQAQATSLDSDRSGAGLSGR